MTRSDAREYLRSIHPHELQYAILREVLEDHALVRWYAAYLHSLLTHGAEPLSEDHRRGHLRTHVEAVQRDLANGERIRIRPEDLVELLASDLPEVRLLAIRLVGRER